MRNLYDIVDDPGTDELIRWTTCPRGRCADGVQNCFEVVDYEGFTERLLAKLCHSTSFCSFVRQLNGYGFSKADPKRAAFSHEYFRRGEPALLASISRRRTSKRRAKGGAGAGGAASRGGSKASGRRAAKKSRSERSSAPAPAPAAPGAIPAARQVTSPSSASTTSRGASSAFNVGVGAALPPPTSAAIGGLPGLADGVDALRCLSDALGTLQSVLMTVETAKASLPAGGPAMRVVDDIRESVGLFVQRQLPSTRPGFFTSRKVISLSEKLGTMMTATDLQIGLADRLADESVVASVLSGDATTSLSPTAAGADGRVSGSSAGHDGGPAGRADAALQVLPAGHGTYELGRDGGRGDPSAHEQPHVTAAAVEAVRAAGLDTSDPATLAAFTAAFSAANAATRVEIDRTRAESASAPSRGPEHSSVANAAFRHDNLPFSDADVDAAGGKVDGDLAIGGDVSLPGLLEDLDVALASSQMLDGMGSGFGSEPGQRFLGSGNSGTLPPDQMDDQ